MALLLSCGMIKKTPLRALYGISQSAEGADGLNKASYRISHG